MFEYREKRAKEIRHQPIADSAEEAIAPGSAPGQMDFPQQDVGQQAIDQGAGEPALALEDGPERGVDQRGMPEEIAGIKVRRYTGTTRPPGILPEIWSKMFTESKEG